MYIPPYSPLGHIGVYSMYAHDMVPYVDTYIMLGSWVMTRHGILTCPNP